VLGWRLDPRTTLRDDEVLILSKLSVTFEPVWNRTRGSSPLPAARNRGVIVGNMQAVNAASRPLAYNGVRKTRYSGFTLPAHPGSTPASYRTRPWN
jgi:hypothetical protein